jgi:hypothetical protein
MKFITFRPEVWYVLHYKHPTIWFSSKSSQIKAGNKGLTLHNEGSFDCQTEYEKFMKYHCSFINKLMSVIPNTIILKSPIWVNPDANPACHLE